MSGLDATRELLNDAIEAARESAEKEEASKTKQNARSSRPRRGRARRKATPTGPIEPGWVHVELANIVLDLLGQGLANTFKSPVDVGQEIEIVGEDGGAPEEDAAEPAELLARIIARIFRATPGLNRIEKHLEGREKRAGLGSDLLALIVQVARRNAHLWPIIREEFKKNTRQAVRQRKAQKGGERNGHVSTIEGGGAR